MSKTANAWINLIFLAITLAVNALGAAGLINGLTQGEISDMYLTLITPAPSTFRIWSVIYGLLVISIIVMLVNKDEYYHVAVEEISGLFRLSCLLNIAWMISFSFVLIEISSLIILAFAITLALICSKLLAIQEGRRWLLPLSFGLYTGWLLIASVINIAAMLVKLEWDRFGIADDYWGVIMLIAAIVLLIVIILRNRNAALPLPIAWAYFGIYSFLKSPNGFNGEYGLLQTVAFVGMAVSIITAVILFFRNRRSILPDF